MRSSLARLDSRGLPATQIPICRGDNGLTKEKATALIVTEEIREADAEYALQRLIDRGYLYLVDDELYVTNSGSDDAEE